MAWAFPRRARCAWWRRTIRYRETVETAAIVTRMAPSFVRFGSFEHWSARRDLDRLATLADYVIDRYYPECRETRAGEPADPNASVTNLLREVTRRTALLMADWQSVGFCHGVMNTDNMSILGLTLDYGPYGFMDGFKLAHLQSLRHAGPLFLEPAAVGGAVEPVRGQPAQPDAGRGWLRAVLDEFEAVFTRAFHARMGAKLGLASWRPEDEALLDDLLKLMDANQADFTLCWRRLADAVLGRRSAFEDLFIDRPAASAWLDPAGASGRRWQAGAGHGPGHEPGQSAVRAAQSSGGAGDPGGAARRRARSGRCCSCCATHTPNAVVTRRMRGCLRIGRAASKSAARPEQWFKVAKGGRR